MHLQSYLILCWRPYSVEESRTKSSANSRQILLLLSSLPTFPWRLHRQQLEIKLPHFTVFHHIHHFARVKSQAIPSKIPYVTGSSSSRSFNWSSPICFEKYSLFEEYFLRHFANMADTWFCNFNSWHTHQLGCICRSNSCKQWKGEVTKRSFAGVQRLHETTLIACHLPEHIPPVGSKMT